MPTHQETRHFPYSPEQLYALVADVARYPEFLPWVRAARIVSQHDGYFLAELVISFKHITEKYTSKVTCQPATADSAGSIDVSMVEGPFHHLVNQWRFAPAEHGGCDVHFMVDFRFKSKLLDAIIGTLFGRATQKMVAAFSDRAHALFGERNH